MAKLNFKNLGLKGMGLNDKVIRAIKKEIKDGDNNFGLGESGLSKTQKAVVKAKILGTTPAKAAATSGIATGLNAVTGLLAAAKKQGQGNEKAAKKGVGDVIEAVGTTLIKGSPDYGKPVVIPGVNNPRPVPFNGAGVPTGVVAAGGGGGTGGGGSSGGGGRTISDILKPYRRAPVPLTFKAFMPGQKEGIANQLAAGYGGTPQSFMDYLDKTHVDQKIPMFQEPISTTASVWDPKKRAPITNTGGGNVLDRLLMGKKVG